MIPKLGGEAKCPEFNGGKIYTTWGVLWGSDDSSRDDMLTHSARRTRPSEAQEREEKGIKYKKAGNVASNSKCYTNTA